MLHVGYLWESFSTVVINNNKSLADSFILMVATFQAVLFDEQMLV